MNNFVYADRVATALPSKEVKQAMIDFINDDVGNPSAHIHVSGIKAAGYIDKARQQVASLINAEPDEIFFTSGATESNNIAVKGILLGSSGNIVISGIEHYSILDQSRNQALTDYEFRLVPVDDDGVIQLDKLEQAIDNNTLLVSVITASPEIGTIQPVTRIKQICEKHGVTFHTDAAAAAGYIPLDVKKSQVDMMTLSSQTLGGPMGVGALYINKKTAVKSLFDGGNQESGVRPGTENVAGIVGYGVACEIAEKKLAESNFKLTEQGQKLWQGIADKIEFVKFTGHQENRLPGHVSFWHQFIEGESLLLHLNMRGIIAASGSACSSNLKGSDEHDLRASHVLTAVGVPEEYCSGSITFSLDYFNTDNDIEYILESLPAIVDRLIAMSPVYEDYLKQREQHG